MAYFYAPSYIVHHPSPYPRLFLQVEQGACPNALDLGEQFYPTPLYSSLSLPLSPTPRVPSPPIPIYNVSYSLAGAMTPVKEPISHPAPLQCRPAVLHPAQPLRYSETDNSLLSPQSRRYSSDLASPEEVVDKPNIDSSLLSLLSPSPPRVLSAKEEDMAIDLTLHDELSQAGNSRRSAGTRGLRGRRAKGQRLQEDDILPPQNEEQPYECDICGVHFVRKHDVERHRRSHTGERPFPCHGGCGKAFRRTDARSRHWSVYIDCELRHTIFLEGTPEGLRHERHIMKRAKRAELVGQGMPRQVIERILKKM